MAPTAFRNQHYKQLLRQCEKGKTKFVDPEFTPDNTSLFFDESTTNDIVWKRPSDLVPNPRLFVDGVAVNDVTQGDLGNCWFVAACSTLTHHITLLDKVIPDRRTQDWKEGKYDAGIFHFRLWRFGHWLDIVIDDFLPTRNGRLIYGRSKTNNEFWSALLEKAFAKMYGCYEALTGGQLSNALTEVSGGVPESIDLSANSEYSKDAHQREQLFYDLKENWTNKALIVAAIRANSADEIEAALECGLLRGHAYAVSNVHQIELDNTQKAWFDFSSNERIRMLRLHNPWGEKEWNGPWSDGSPEWNKVTEAQKKELGIVVEEDGEFWINWDDFCHYFSTISVCHVNSSGLFATKNFHESLFYGSWKRTSKPNSLSDRSGGCLNNRATFLNNPQYLFEVPVGGLAQVGVALTQKDYDDDPSGRRQRATYLTIGMHVMKVEENRSYRVHQTQEAMGTSAYSPTRSVFIKLRNLMAGRYVIVPTTFEPGRNGQFMIRIHAPQHLHCRELLQHAPSRGVFDTLCSCCRRDISCVTRLKLVEARLLEDKAGKRAQDPYCLIKCEGDKPTTRYITGTASPPFNMNYIFYRRLPEKPIIIELWDFNYVKDSFLGRVEQPAPIDNENRRITCALRGQSQSDPVMNGSIVIELATYDDPVYL